MNESIRKLMHLVGTQEEIWIAMMRFMNTNLQKNIISFYYSAVYI